MEYKFNKDVKRFNIGGVEIIGNLQNGSYCGLSEQGKSVVNLIENGEDLSLLTRTSNRKLLGYLKDAGFFSDNLDKNTILSAYLHVTNRCNLRCVGCYSEDSTRNCEQDLTLEQEQLILDKLVKLGVKMLVISGGETVLRNDLHEIVRYAKETTGFPYICILSNGLLLTDERAQQLAPYVDEYSISIDSFDENGTAYIRRENRFTDLMKAVEIAKKYFKKVNILPTLHRKNIDDIDKYIKLAQKLSVAISFSILTCSGDGETGDLIPDRAQLEYLGQAFKPGEQIDLRSKDVNEFTMTACEKCGIGEQILSIGANGNVYPCHMCHDDTLKLGNILTDDIQNILERRDQCICHANTNYIDECNECKYKYFCGGGCRARAFMNTGTLSGKDPYCPMFKAYIQSFEKMIQEKYGIC